MVIIFSSLQTLHYYNNFVFSAIFRFVTQRGCSGITTLESQLINKSRKLKEFVGKDQENPLNNKSS
jgi:hypothetical protein